MYSTHQEPFKSCAFYLVLDILYLIFAILYNIGDVDHADNFLKYVKPIPVWILMIELFTIRSVHKHIKTIIVGLFFGSAGDLLLLWSQNDIAFGLGALSFLVGHVFYVTAFVFFAETLIGHRISLEDVLKPYPIFIIIWLVFMTFSFFSISTIITYLSQDDSIRYVLDVYGAVLTLVTMGGFFFFFTTFKLPNNILLPGVFYMLGSLIFYASDNFIAHGKFNTWYSDRVSLSLNSYLIMITYYIAQFLISKGTFLVAANLVQEPPSKQPQELRNEKISEDRFNSG